MMRSAQESRRHLLIDKSSLSSCRDGNKVDIQKLKSPVLSYSPFFELIQSLPQNPFWKRHLEDLPLCNFPPQYVTNLHIFYLNSSILDLSYLYMFLIPNAFPFSKQHFFFFFNLFWHTGLSILVTFLDIFQCICSHSIYFFLKHR